MSSAQSASAFSADAPRYGVEPAAAYYALHDAVGAQGVDGVTVGSNTITGDVTFAQGTGITITSAGNTVTITASGAGVASVTGTATQISASNVAGAVTVGLLPPSPAPTAGSYSNANITVDGLGRVTAAASGSTPTPPAPDTGIQYILPQAGGGAGKVIGSTSTGVLARVAASGITVPAGTAIYINLGTQDGFFGNGGAALNAAPAIALTSNHLYDIVASTGVLSIDTNGSADIQVSIFAWNQGSNVPVWPSPTGPPTNPYPAGIYNLLTYNSPGAIGNFNVSAGMRAQVVGLGQNLTTWAMVSSVAGLSGAGFTYQVPAGATFFVEDLGAL